jgi:N-carbamoylputrescine amidase
VIFAPRATAAASVAKWLAVGVVAAVRSGAYCVSSNRVDAAGNCGGVGWIISPDGTILATTSAATPCITVDLDLAAPAAARRSYPRYLFNGPGPTAAQGDFAERRRIA